MAKSIHQEVSFSASPDKVYAALTDAGQFSEVTGAPAKIDGAAGGAAELFGGQIAARNVEMNPGKRLVQAWRAGNWEDGLYSVVRFELQQDGAGTKLVFDHTGYPDEAHDQLEGGWHQMYWEPLTKYFS